jgi:hypothetical protein
MNKEREKRELASDPLNTERKKSASQRSNEYREKEIKKLACYPLNTDRKKGASQRSAEYR